MAAHGAARNEVSAPGAAAPDDDASAKDDDVREPVAASHEAGGGGGSEHGEEEIDPNVYVNSTNSVAHYFVPFPLHSGVHVANASSTAPPSPSPG